MAKAFNEKDRTKIRRDLMIQGRALFEIYGLKKTSVDDITTKVGISKGSFYNFFGSKEELFFFIVEEEERFRDGLVKELIASDIDAGEALRQMFTTGLKMVAGSKIMEKLYEPGVYEHLLRKLPPDKLAAHQENDHQAAIDFIRHFQRTSNLCQVEPDILSSLFRAFFLITLHKNEIGNDIYPQVMELIINALSKGLVEGGDQ